MTTKYKKLLTTLLPQNNPKKSPTVMPHNVQAGENLSYSQKEIDAITANILRNYDNLPIVDHYTHKQVNEMIDYVAEVNDGKLITDNLPVDFVGDLIDGKNPRYFNPDSIDFSIHQNPSVEINKIPTETKTIVFVNKSGVDNDSFYVSIPSATNMLGLSVIGDNAINCLIDFDGQKIGANNEVKYLEIIDNQNSGCYEYKNLGINVLKNQLRFFEITGKSGFYLHFVNTANKAVADYTEQALFCTLEFYKN